MFVEERINKMIRDREQLLGLSGVLDAAINSTLTWRMEEYGIRKSFSSLQFFGWEHMEGIVVVERQPFFCPKRNNFKIVHKYNKIPYQGLK